LRLLRCHALRRATQQGTAAMAGQLEEGQRSAR